MNLGHLSVKRLWRYSHCPVPDTVVIGSLDAVLLLIVQHSCPACKAQLFPFAAQRAFYQLRECLVDERRTAEFTFAFDAFPNG